MRFHTEPIVLALGKFKIAVDSIVVYDCVAVHCLLLPMCLISREIPIVRIMRIIRFCFKGPLLRCKRHQHMSTENPVFSHSVSMLNIRHHQVSRKWDVAFSAPFYNHPIHIAGVPICLAHRNIHTYFAFAREKKTENSSCTKWTIIEQDKRVR